MAVTATDLKLYKSQNNTGGAITATEATGSNVFGVISGADTAAGGTFSALVYLKNDAAQTAFNMEVWVDSETSHPGVNAKIALATEGLNTTVTGTADIKDDPGVTTVEADGQANALTIGDMAAGAYIGVWVELTVQAGTAPKDLYSITIGRGGETGE